MNRRTRDAVARLDAFEARQSCLENRVYRVETMLDDAVRRTYALHTAMTLPSERRETVGAA